MIRATSTTRHRTSALARLGAPSPPRDRLVARADRGADIAAHQSIGLAVKPREGELDLDVVAGGQSRESSRHDVMAEHLGLVVLGPDQVPFVEDGVAVRIAAGGNDGIGDPRRPDWLPRVADRDAE